MGRQLLADIKGVIKELNISVGDVLYPFYEIVVNSIQAIGEQFENLTNGSIRVTINRDKTQGSLFERYSNYPIESITITDNGIGFNPSNFESFTKAHSTKKIALGGKGLGRFAVLSVFKTISVRSIYKSSSSFKQITFSLNEDGISDPIITETKATAPKTEIILEGIHERFLKESSKYSHEVISDNILAHCLLYFLSEEAPKIVIEEDGMDINLSNQFSPKEFVKFNKIDNIKGQNFRWYVVKRQKGKFHELVLCAHNRKVKGKKVEKLLPIFTSPIIESSEDGDVDNYFTIYVVSPYLDQIVNSTRNEFKFPKDKKEGDMDSTLDLDIENLVFEKDIEEKSISIIGELFQDVLTERAEIAKQRIDTFRGSDEGIEFRHLHLDQDFYNTIPDNADSKKISDALYELSYKHDKQRREKRDKLFERDYANTDDYQDLMKEVANLESEEGRSRLAQYISHRKTIIALLERYLGWCDDNNNYEEEQVLHNLIYTMGGSESTISYDKHNLWLIDDRLTFHKYIYSDVKIKKQKPVETSSSGKEPDIAIYDIPFAYGDKDNYDRISSVVIFELKRPNRNMSYEAFSKQMRDQIKGIKKGKAKDSHGISIGTQENTPIYFYFVCDAATYAKFKEDAIEEGFKETPYQSLMRMTGENVYQEILTYQTILLNAKRRNLVFFKKLGLE